MPASPAAVRQVCQVLEWSHHHLFYIREEVGYVIVYDEREKARLDRLLLPTVLGMVVRVYTVHDPPSHMPVRAPYYNLPPPRPCPPSWLTWWCRCCWSRR